MRKRIYIFQDELDYYVNANKVLAMINEDRVIDYFVKEFDLSDIFNMISDNVRSKKHVYGEISRENIIDKVKNYTADCQELLNLVDKEDICNYLMSIYTLEDFVISIHNEIERIER